LIQQKKTFLHFSFFITDVPYSCELRRTFSNKEKAKFQGPLLVHNEPGAGQGVPKKVKDSTKVYFKVIVINAVGQVFST